MQKRKLPEVTQAGGQDKKKNKKEEKKGTKRKIPAVLDSFAPDNEIEELILPKPAYSESEEEEANQRFAEVRKKGFWKDYEKGLEAIEQAKKDGEEYNAEEAMGYISPQETPEEIWKKAPNGTQREEDDLFAFDEKTGKYRLKRAPVIKTLSNYNVWFPFDGTFIFAGIRRSGKTFGVRDVLYHMRHNFAGGIVFSATKHNGFWRKHIPNSFIHEELDGAIIDRFLAWRAKEIEDYSRDFSGEAKDPQPLFIILDDCVDQDTRYKTVRSSSSSEGDRVLFWGAEIHGRVLRIFLGEYTEGAHCRSRHGCMHRVWHHEAPEEHAVRWFFGHAEWGITGWLWDGLKDTPWRRLLWVHKGKLAVAWVLGRRFGLLGGEWNIVIFLSCLLESDRPLL